MLDWRLDSTSGGNNLPFGGVVCGVGEPNWMTQKCGGGGYGAQTWMPLDKVCREHIVVLGGEVRNRGFIVDPNAMSIRFEHSIPEHVQVYVVGFGGVVREKAVPYYQQTFDLDKLFPTPTHIRFGNHPYGELGKVSDADTGKRYKRITREVRTAALPLDMRWMHDVGVYGRMDHKRLFGLGYYNGRSVAVADYNPWSLQGARLVRDIPTAQVGDFRHVTGTGWFPVLFPNSSGEFYQMPLAVNFPVIKWLSDGTHEVMPIGPLRSGAFVDPFTASALVASACFTSAFRLFDGRVLLIPYTMPSGNNTNGTSFAIFDPEAETFTEIPFATAGLTVTGATRWKMPTQARDGKVYMLPATFPGNLTLIFDPATDTFEQDDFDIAYPRADILHSAGVATADGRIIYAQTAGAATDVNTFLILDLANRTHTRTDFGLVKSTLYSAFFMTGMTPDGSAVFMCNPNNWSTTTYQVMIYNWHIDDYVLYRWQGSTLLPVTTTYQYDTRFAGSSSNLFLWLERGGYVERRGPYSSYQPLRYVTYEAPPVECPGAYERLMYFGYMM